MKSVVVALVTTALGAGFIALTLSRLDTGDELRLSLVLVALGLILFVITFIVLACARYMLARINKRIG